MKRMAGPCLLQCAYVYVRAYVCFHIRWGCWLWVFCRLGARAAGRDVPDIVLPTRCNPTPRVMWKIGRVGRRGGGRECVLEAEWDAVAEPNDSEKGEQLFPAPPMRFEAFQVARKESVCKPLVL